MAEKIKKATVEEVQDIKQVDTVYLLIKIMTLREKLIIQAVEYNWAATEAKKNSNADSLYYESTGNRLLSQSGRMDSTSLLYYIGAAHVIFTYKNSQKGMIDKRMFFDEDLNVVSKYSIINKVAKIDDLKSEPQTYEPFTPEEYEQFARDRILKYY